MAKLGTQYEDLMVSERIDEAVFYLIENMGAWENIMPVGFSAHMYDAMKVAVVRYFRQDGNKELVDLVIENLS